MDENYFGRNIVKSISITFNSTEIFKSENGSSTITHENGKKEDCHFCKKDSLFTLGSQHYYGKHHKYVLQDGNGIWEAHQEKNGICIYSISDIYDELFRKTRYKKESYGKLNGK